MTDSTLQRMRDDEHDADRLLLDLRDRHAQALAALDEAYAAGQAAQDEVQRCIRERQEAVKAIVAHLELQDVARVGLQS